MEVLYGVEGATDAPIARKLIECAGLIAREGIVAGGKSTLDTRLKRWNSPGNRTPILALRDWDVSDASPCASALIEKVAGGRVVAPRLLLRIAVRSLEAWLLADHEACWKFFGIPAPRDPDTLPDAKDHLVNACRETRKRRIRDGIVPHVDSGARVGAEYTALIVAYGQYHWRVDRAKKRSPSLQRAVRRLEELARSGMW